MSTVITKPAKKFTGAQIKAICDKLQRDFNPKTVFNSMHESHSDTKKEANLKIFRAIVKNSNLPGAVKISLTKLSWWDIGEKFSMKDRKSLEFPYPNPNVGVSQWDISKKHTKMVEDLKFSLTMADQGSHLKVMAEFQAKVKKAFSK